MGIYVLLLNPCRSLLSLSLSLSLSVSHSLPEKPCAALTNVVSPFCQRFVLSWGEKYEVFSNPVALPEGRACPRVPHCLQRPCREFHGHSQHPAQATLHGAAGLEPNRATGDLTMIRFPVAFFVLCCCCPGDWFAIKGSG